MKLDYTPLTQKVTLRERLEDGWGKWVLVSLTLIVISLSYQAVLYVLRGTSSLTILSIILIGAGVYIAVATYIFSAKQIRLERFAAKNNITYRQNLPYDNRPGIFFSIGHSKRFTELFLFSSPGIEIGNYKYTTGSGKYSQDHLVGYVRLALPRRLPHMVLDSRKNNLFGNMSNMSYGFSGDQKLSLEGDFDKYFTLFAPATYKRDALYVFTPDIMQLLMATVPGFDVEIIDDTMYIYSKTPLKLMKQSQLESLTQVAAVLSAKFSRQTDYYADERVGDRSQNSIATPGARLKAHVPSSVILAAIGFVLYLALIFVVPLWIGRE